MNRGRGSVRPVAAPRPSTWKGSGRGRPGSRVIQRPQPGASADHPIEVSGALNPSPIRHSPRTSVTRVNYRQLENLARIDEPIRNPVHNPTGTNPTANAPATPSRLRHVDNADGDDEFQELSDGSVFGDTDHVYNVDDEDETVDPQSPSHGRDRPKLPATITLRSARERKLKVRKPQPERTFCKKHFDILHQEEVWQKTSVMGHPWVQDRLWICKYCNDFKSLDSGRHGNTSNLVKHLKDDHHFTRADDTLGRKPKNLKSGKDIPIDQYLQEAPVQLSKKEAFLRFFIMTDQPFSMCEDPHFQRIYTSMGQECPFTNGQTFYRYVEKRFNEEREEQQKLLQPLNSCSIAMDGWGSQNHHEMIGGIIDALHPKSFDRIRIVAEYALAEFGKTGEGMAEVLYASFGNGVDEQEIIETEDGPKERQIKQVGLKIANKIIAITADNATNNDTFCDHLQSMLEEEFNDNHLFEGRGSRIRCLAHIIALVAKSIYKNLRAGSRQESVNLVNDVLNKKRGARVFPASCSSMSVYQKVRAFVLWLMSSKERRKAWKRKAKKMIPLDVEIRWNSLYLMMLVARQLKKEMDTYKDDPAVAAIIPTAQDWQEAEQIEIALEGFYDLTLTVSNRTPYLNEYLQLMWNLEKTLEDVAAGHAHFEGTPEYIRNAFEDAKSVLQGWMDEAESNDLVLTAHTLDPRHKFASFYKHYHHDKAAVLEKRVKEYCIRHFPPRFHNELLQQEERPEDFPIHIWENLQQMRAESPESDTSGWDRYWGSSRVKQFLAADRDWCVRWWCGNRTNYPECADAAAALLAIPCTEVDVERLFSSGKQAIEGRFLLDPRAMRMCMLLKAHWAAQEQKLKGIAEAAQAHHQAEYAPRRVEMVENLNGSFSSV